MNESIPVFVNNDRYPLPAGNVTAEILKATVGAPENHAVFVEEGRHHPITDRCCGDVVHEAELRELENSDAFHLQPGQCYWVRPHPKIEVTINNASYVFRRRHQTGQSLKERAGIPSDDVLFLDGKDDDRVITNDTKIRLEKGQRFHSAPPANYGAPTLGASDVGSEHFQLVDQPQGWTFLILRDFLLPEAFTPNRVRLLVKLPPAFPDAAPDMFWVHPQVKVAAAGAPQGTSMEPLLGQAWQRFSWHLQSGAWRPGASTLRDFMRCVCARLEQRN
ncbi:MAG: E2/UBC family protein [Gammaproteobacteria bacterium]